MSPSAPPLHALLLEAAPWPEAVGVAGPLSLLPVLLAIGLTLWTRQVLVSLGAGLLMGAALLVGLRPHAAVLAVVDPLIIDTIADRGHVKVTIFSLFIAATVAVAGRAGATRTAGTGKQAGHGVCRVFDRRGRGTGADGWRAKNC
jgi:hypothetical protein